VRRLLKQGTSKPERLVSVGLQRAVRQRARRVRRPIRLWPCTELLVTLCPPPQCAACRFGKLMSVGLEPDRYLAIPAVGFRSSGAPGDAHGTGTTAERIMRSVCPPVKPF
jgi:hypothetical protein